VCMGNSRKISIQLGDEKAIAVLLDDKAPETCEAIWNTLPYETEAHHSRICNHEIIFAMPVVVDMENPVLPVVGDVGYWCVRQCVNLWYDEMKPLGKTALFAKITENLEGFRKEAIKVWQHPGGKIKLDKV
jgi:hypothetical protein